MTSVLSRLNVLQRSLTSHVLLYHATFTEVPSDLREYLHNVPPKQLHRQLTWYKQHFDFVPVDELFEGERRGKVAVSFDDAYQCVFDEALPVLRALGIPCTIYVNAGSLGGKPLWRDRVRFLINTKRVTSFLEFYEHAVEADHPFTPRNFYRMSKHPSVDGALLDRTMQQYFEEEGIAADRMAYVVHDLASLPTGPLVTYGNHSLHHYVLSSLTPLEQEEEIRRNHELMVASGVRLSNTFSIPFGTPRDFNHATLDLIAACGYTSFLYSRNRIELCVGADRCRQRGLLFAERFRVPSDETRFHRRLVKLGLRSGARRLKEAWMRS